jgi:hypothetical protein
MSKPYRIYERCLKTGRFALAYRIINKHFESFPHYEDAPGVADLYKRVAELTVAKNQKKNVTVP